MPMLNQPMDEPQTVLFTILVLLPHLYGHTCDDCGRARYQVSQEGKGFLRMSSNIFDLNCGSHFASTLRGRVTSVAHTAVRTEFRSLYDLGPGSQTSFTVRRSVEFVY
ncbi:hypothetical protein FB45DRAFT_84409 [Roridomyces roridus]|uniref:Secreted protein n=1 Tax=Roridomyces roridus TaxID=1738132 RepID=A0AAD7FK02_9AGAR|nr:hypothetical protein FB45DRAFT_84409 [Roridomyces roridus]